MNDNKIDEDLARRAVEEQWGECYSSPEDAETPLPPGTVEQCSTPEGEEWERVWCHDGTARSIPDEDDESVTSHREAARGLLPGEKVGGEDEDEEEECECTCGCCEPATTYDEAPLCEECAAYTTDDDDQVVCSRVSTCETCGVDRLVETDHGHGWQPCDCEREERRGLEDRDPEGDWAVVDMDGGEVSRHASYEGASLAIGHEADGHALLKASSHGAYSSSYWPRSIIHVPCGQRRGGQYSTSWYSPGCDHAPAVEY